MLYKMLLLTTLQTHYVYSTLKRRGNSRFHVVSTWNTHGVFLGNIPWFYPNAMAYTCEKSEKPRLMIFKKHNRKKQTQYFLKKMIC